MHARARLSPFVITRDTERARLPRQGWRPAGSPCTDRSGPLSTGNGERNKRGSDPFMLHVTCDLCGKELRPGEDHHFVVKVEVFAAHDPTALTEADLDEDHMEAFGELLREAEDPLAGDPLPPACQQMRYDL